MLSGLHRDKVTIEKADGSTYGPYQASVQKNKIFMEAKHSLESGDILIREMPYGDPERYVVEEPNFFQGTHGIAPNYQADVVREGKSNSGAKPENRPSQTAYKSNQESHHPSQITYNVYGEHVRFNQNSTDNSVNVTVNNEGTVFEELRQALNENVEDKQKLDDLLAAVDEMESSQHDSQKLSETLGKFISKGADVMAVIGPFIPLITGIATGGLS